jgi:hypothetical protein
MACAEPLSHCNTYGDLYQYPQDILLLHTTIGLFFAIDALASSTVYTTAHHFMYHKFLATVGHAEINAHFVTSSIHTFSASNQSSLLSILTSDHSWKFSSLLQCHVL